MISDELFDQMRECWAGRIPEPFSPLHLAADQRRTKEARERCGKPGRRKGDNLTSAGC
jgi:hypothetical protein